MRGVDLAGEESLVPDGGYALAFFPAVPGGGGGVDDCAADVAAGDQWGVGGGAVGSVMSVEAHNDCNCE